MSIWLAVPSPSPTGPPLGEQAGASIGYWIIVGLILIGLIWVRLKFGPPGKGRTDW